MNYEELIAEREKCREHIRSCWKAGKHFDKSDHEISRKTEELHQQILEIEKNMTDKPQFRICYSVCGWSEKHGYFRNKNFTSESLQEAIAEFFNLKSDPSWRIPTLIVKQTCTRAKSPSMVDFDNDPIGQLHSNYQEIVEKHLMNCPDIHRWSDLLTGLEDRYTY